MIAFDMTLRETLSQMDISFDDDMITRSAEYAAYLLDENQKMNLTAIVDEQAVAVKHFADSLAILKYCELSRGASLVDIGSGAGFPGMVLKIFRPDLKITLIDSLKKRCYFLERLAREIGIEDVPVVWGRAEEMGRKEEMRECFDFAAARAVASLPILLEYTVPFVKPGGKILAMKAKEEQSDPQNALTALNCVVDEVVRYDLKGETRALFIIGKEGKLDDKYPRRPGMPEKRPL